ncbi:NAD-dependent epimerase/dehydratase family protein [Hymenobacter sp. HMF4947]|uniref:NAD-dependent epimerase/dehydratase family protein n=1 Tax=Hymenobacter ginkgonis TaxID=2682976 RepID=A0A7K1TI69_9BACT|nr:SDR family oxidoreductase [Hymenobacter ginkgonis]MVN78063.1 NAD-dependent epimerase/dehydratase family protein [Hymenobacter ginkgonis]
MRVFVTGATGFIGSAIVQELLGAGHQVLGLARSEKAAQALAAAGAEAHRGSLDDLDSLRSGAAAADGVIHTAFIHDFSAYAAAGETDRHAIEALGGALADAGRPLVVAAGLAGFNLGRPATEADAPAASLRMSEQAALAQVAQGVRASVIRLSPSVHDKGDYGFVPTLIDIARQKGEAAYVGDGLNRWAAVHRLDAAHLFRLALEQGVAGGRYHGVADEGIAMRDIAAVIGQHLNLPVVAKSPEEAAEHFGWMGRFVGLDLSASSAQTQQQLGWRPSHPSLLADLEQGHYFHPKQ